jgi:hypothetical protein
MVEIEYRRYHQLPMQTQQQTSPQWQAICCSYSMGSMDLPNPMHTSNTTSLDRVGQECLGLVLYEMIK